MNISDSDVNNEGARVFNTELQLRYSKVSHLANCREVIGRECLPPFYTSPISLQEISATDGFISVTTNSITSNAI